MNFDRFEVGLLDTQQEELREHSVCKGCKVIIFEGEEVLYHEDEDYYAHDEYLCLRIASRARLIVAGKEKH